MDRPPRTKIAIIGYTSHKAKAPWTNPEWEMWALNDLYVDLGIFNDEGYDLSRLRWFQLHTWNAVRDWDKIAAPGDELNANFGPRHKRDPNHMLWLREASEHFPVYLNAARPELPSALAYPYEEVFEYFGRYYTASEKFRYFTNSITLMIGLAIKTLCPDPDDRAPEGAQIAVYGVDMQVGGSEVNSEYGYQRPSCEWAVGYCMGHGIQLTLPEESDLCKSAFVYGDEEQFYLRKRINAYHDDLEQKRIMSANQRNLARENEMRMIGAKEALEWLMRNHLPGDDSEGQVPIAHGHKLPMG